MDFLFEDKGLKLIKKYGSYYIRFIGGSMEEYPCDLKIEQEEAEKILSGNVNITNVLADYKKRLLWTMDYFMDTYFSDYYSNECSANKLQILCLLSKLKKHKDIRSEFYSSLVYGAFPLSGGLEVSNYTAKDLGQEFGLPIHKSYELLISLRENGALPSKNLMEDCLEL